MIAGTSRSSLGPRSTFPTRRGSLATTGRCLSWSFIFSLVKSQNSRCDQKIPFSSNPLLLPGRLTSSTCRTRWSRRRAMLASTCMASMAGSKKTFFHRLKLIWKFDFLRFVMIQLFFAAKWILISEVTFESGEKIHGLSFQCGNFREVLL